MADSAEPNWIVDRSASDSLKWSKYRGTDVLPMWVADMDFRCAEPILEALHQRIDHGVFGYTISTSEAKQAIVDWLSSQHHWHVEPDWIVFVPGLVSALHSVCRAYAKDDGHVMTFTPVYPPFMSSPKQSNRQLLTCPLQEINGSYTFDLDQFENTLTDKTETLLLCSPHNPVGRVWTQDELTGIAEICLKRNILLCSDEIHCDLVLNKNTKHIPTATLSADIADRTVTLMSPAKTFNLPGLNCGFAIISNHRLREQFKKASYGVLPWVNTLGYVACRAAFSEGLGWLNEVLEYLRDNHRILCEAVNTIEGLSMAPLEATYLAWIDVRKLKHPNPAALFKQAGVGVMDGAEFGQSGFVRLNFACSRTNLMLAIDRIKTALAQL
ncbi:MAG: MalY/PatB family protein [Planctomycetota bacterium]|jgi:cystathionine beta-lyase